MMMIMFCKNVCIWQKWTQHLYIRRLCILEGCTKMLVNFQEDLLSKKFTTWCGNVKNWRVDKWETDSPTPSPCIYRIRQLLCLTILGSLITTPCSSPPSPSITLPPQSCLFPLQEWTRNLALPTPLAYLCWPLLSCQGLLEAFLEPYLVPFPHMCWLLSTFILGPSLTDTLLRIGCELPLWAFRSGPVRCCKGEV